MWRQASHSRFEAVALDGTLDGGEGGEMFIFAEQWRTAGVQRSEWILAIGSCIIASQLIAA
jgi:hypothetical protein